MSDDAEIIYVDNDETVIVSQVDEEATVIESTEAGPPGADSTVPGPPGADSIVPGPTGANGRTILNGAATPDEYDGIDGDFYIDTAAFTIYGPKIGGAWGEATSLVGPQGPAGTDTMIWSIVFGGG